MGAIICKGEYYGGSDVMEITQADYDALSSEQKNNGTLYVIKDAPSIIDIIYPVGSIYMSVNNVNPGTYLKDTAWEAWGSGRVPVGVDTSQTEFDAVEETGGSKTHTHDVGLRLNGWYNSTMGLEGANGICGIVKYDSSNNISAPDAPVKSSDATLSINNALTNATRSTSTSIYQSVGNTSYVSNLQPYITCYMWKRTH